MPYPYILERVTSPATATVNLNFAPVAPNGDTSILKLSATRSVIWDLGHAVMLDHSNPYDLVLGTPVALFASVPGGLTPQGFVRAAVTTDGDIFFTCWAHGYVPSGMIAQLVHRSGMTLDASNTPTVHGAVLDASAFTPTQGCCIRPNRLVMVDVGRTFLWRFDSTGIVELLLDVTKPYTGYSPDSQFCIDAHNVLISDINVGEMNIVHVTDSAITFSADHVAPYDVGGGVGNWSNGIFVRPLTNNRNKLRLFYLRLAAVTPNGWGVLFYDLDVAIPAITYTGEMEAQWPEGGYSQDIDGLYDAGDPDGPNRVSVQTDDNTSLAPWYFAGGSGLQPIGAHIHPMGPTSYTDGDNAGINVADGLVLIQGQSGGVAQVQLLRVSPVAPAVSPSGATGLSWGPVG